MSGDPVAMGGSGSNPASERTNRNDSQRYFQTGSKLDHAAGEHKQRRTAEELGDITPEGEKQAASAEGAAAASDASGEAASE